MFLAKAAQGGKVARAGAAAVNGLIPGAVADFILTDPREGNLSNSIRDLVPEQYRDNVAFALAAKEDDNPWINRLRSTFEGGHLMLLVMASLLLSLATRPLVRYWKQVVLKMKHLELVSGQHQISQTS